MFLTSYSR